MSIATVWNGVESYLRNDHLIRELPLWATTFWGSLICFPSRQILPVALRQVSVSCKVDSCDVSGNIPKRESSIIYRKLKLLLRLTVYWFERRGQDPYRCGLFTFVRCRFINGTTSFWYRPFMCSFFWTEPSFDVFPECNRVIYRESFALSLGPLDVERYAILEYWSQFPHFLRCCQLVIRWMPRLMLSSYWLSKQCVYFEIYVCFLVFIANGCSWWAPIIEG